MLRFAELVQAATGNLKEAVKEGLATVDAPKPKDANLEPAFEVPLNMANSKETSKSHPKSNTNTSRELDSLCL